MKKYSLLFLIYFVASVPAHGLPHIQHWQTKQNVPVYFIQTEGLPILDAKLVLTAGSVFDQQQKGLARLTGSLLDEGTKSNDAQQIAERFERVGAQFGVSVNHDKTSLNLRTLSDSVALKAAWSNFHDVLLNPVFPEKELNRIKQQTLLGIKKRDESLSTIVTHAHQKNMYGTHPYATPVEGEMDTVELITRADIRRFYQRYFVQENAQLFLVGGVTREQAEQLATQLLNDLPSGEQAISPAVYEVDQVIKAQHIEKASEQTHIRYGLPVIERNDPDFFPLYVGNHVLGGSGFSSRVVKEIREERGLAYSAYSYFHPKILRGYFVMGMQTRNEKAKEAVEALNELLNDFIENGPTDEELLAAKQNISGGFALNLDSNKKLLSNMVNIVLSGKPLNYLEGYLAKIESVNKNQIIDAFRRRITPEKMSLVTVGKRVPDGQ